MLSKELLSTHILWSFVRYGVRSIRGCNMLPFQTCVYKLHILFFSLFVPFVIFEMVEKNGKDIIFDIFFLRILSHTQYSHKNNIVSQLSHYTITSFFHCTFIKPKRSGCDVFKLSCKMILPSIAKYLGTMRQKMLFLSKIPTI